MMGDRDRGSPSAMLFKNRLESQVLRYVHRNVDNLVAMVLPRGISVVDGKMGRELLQC
jgi:hypothetical protein